VINKEGLYEKVASSKKVSKVGSKNKEDYYLNKGSKTNSQPSSESISLSVKKYSSPK
jgi:hypothetical protein